MPARREALHRPMARWFPEPRTEAELRPHELSADQLEHFNHHGYVSGLDVLDAAAVHELRARLEALRRRLPEIAEDLYEVEAGWQERPDRVVLHFLGAWRVDEVLHDLVFAPQATVPAASALGVRRLRFWHDQVFYKPPHHDAVVPWHQDYSYWTRTVPPGHVTLNVVLDDTTVQNGCLHVVPGSHRWPLLPKIDFAGPMDQLLASLPPELARHFQPVPLPLRAGQASLHHSHLVHGSFTNATSGPRRAVVLNYMAPKTRSATDQPLLAGTPRVPSGAVIDNAFFPIVLDRDLLAAGG